MSEFPTPQRFPHPTGGEIEECVRTPEVVITREWESLGGAQAPYGRYQGNQVNFGIYCPNRDYREPNEMLVWEIELVIEKNACWYDDDVLQLELMYNGIKRVDALTEGMYVKQSRPHSRFIIYPHPVAFCSFASRGVQAQVKLVRTPDGGSSAGSPGGNGRVVVTLHGYMGYTRTTSYKVVR